MGRIQIPENAPCSSNSSLVKNLITGLLLSASLPVVAAGYQVTTIASGLDKPGQSPSFPTALDFWSRKNPDSCCTFLTLVKARRLPVCHRCTSRARAACWRWCDPGFAMNKLLYLSYAGGDADANRTTVVRAQLDDGQLVQMETILEVEPDKKKAAHYGGKLAFSRRHPVGQRR